MRLIIALLLLSLTACGGGRALAPVGGIKDYSRAAKKSHYKPAKPPVKYRVKKGDTLYSISWRYGMNYKTLAKINRIKSPYLLQIGQTLVFKPSKATKIKSSTRKTSKTTTKKVTAKKSSTKTTVTRSVKWVWPTKGKVISTYSTKYKRKGIKIAGHGGQAVKAAASGKVVYGGDGLPRYGNLLIIKHNDEYLSAYAHNARLLVKEGDYVKRGQQIATLGHTGTQRYQLHFEIRRDGQPVNPLSYLPKR